MTHQKEPWIPWLEGFKPAPRDPNIPKVPLHVSNLIDPVTQRWRIELLKDLVDSDSLLAIEKIVIPTGARKDKLIWTWTPKESS